MQDKDRSVNASPTVDAKPKTGKSGGRSPPTVNPMEQFMMGEMIATGTYGRIHKAKHIRTGRTVAVKIIDYHKLDTRDRQQLKREVRALRSVTNPYIVQYITHYVDRVTKHLSIVTEYCANDDLETFIRQRRASHTDIDEMEVWTVLAELASALNSLHSSNFLHRDVKPANIFIDADGDVKLGDLGSSRSLAPDELASTWAGTPYYTAPEVWGFGAAASYNEKADCWSLGATVYELITGRPPFTDRSRDAPRLRAKIAEEPVRRIPLRFSEELWEIVSGLLSKRPEERPSAAQLLGVRRIHVMLRTRALRKRLAALREERVVLEKRIRRYAPPERPKTPAGFATPRHSPPPLPDRADSG